MFWHLDPAPNPEANYGGGSASGPGGTEGKGGDRGRLVAHINVPVLDTSAWAAEWVESGTVLVVLLGFAWVVWRLLPSLGLRSGSNAGKKTVGRGAGAGAKAEGGAMMDNEKEREEEKKGGNEEAKKKKQ